jgi:hypothetical protein
LRKVACSGASEEYDVLNCNAVKFGERVASISRVEEYAKNETSLKSPEYYTLQTKKENR